MGKLPGRTPPNPVYFSMASMNWNGWSVQTLRPFLGEKTPVHELLEQVPGCASDVENRLFKMPRQFSKFDAHGKKIYLDDSPEDRAVVEKLVATVLGGERQAWKLSWVWEGVSFELLPDMHGRTLADVMYSIMQEAHHRTILPSITQGTKLPLPVVTHRILPFLATPRQSFFMPDFNVELV